MTDIANHLRDAHDSLLGQAYDRSIFLSAADEIDRLRAIVRVNGLRWGHSHAEIDAMLKADAAAEVGGTSDGS